MDQKARILLNKFFIKEFKSKYMDICWEFADSEVFLVDGWLLVRLICYINRGLHKEFHENSLHSIYLAEKFLSCFKDRGGIFTLVFFSDFEMDVMEEILIHHFKVNSSVEVLTQFKSPFDNNFVEYVHKFRPSFILTSFYDRLHFFQYASIGLNMAEILDMTRTVVKRCAWYHSSFYIPARIMKIVNTEYKKRQPRGPKKTGNYEHSGNASLTVFYEKLITSAEGKCGDTACQSYLYARLLCDALKLHLSVKERREMFPHFFKRKEGDKPFSCCRTVLDCLAENLRWCPSSLLPALLDTQLHYNLIQYLKETGSLDILPLVTDEKQRALVAEDLNQFKDLRAQAEEFYKNLDIQLLQIRRSNEHKVTPDTFFLTSHPLHTLFPKDVLKVLDQEKVLQATKNPNPRYERFEERTHWHTNTKKLTTEFDRIKSSFHGGAGAQNLAAFMRRYGTSLEGRNVCSDPIIAKDISETSGQKQKKKTAGDKTSEKALKILHDKHTEDFRIKAKALEEKISNAKRSLEAEENALAEVKCSFSKLKGDIGKLKAKISNKSKLLDNVNKVELEMKGVFGKMQDKLVSRMIKQRFDLWDTHRTDDNLIKFVLVIKDNQKIIQSLEEKKKIGKYLLKTGFGDLAMSLCGISSDDPSRPFIRFQLERMGKHIVKTAPDTLDPRIQNFNPDLWQRDIFDAIDARDSALIIAPTSSGKTYAAYYAMESVLKESDDGVIVYVAPTKALVNQVAATVSARYSHRKELPPGKSVYGTFTRDYRYFTQDCQILVTVPECLEILMMCPLNFHWVKRMRYVIFDEIHNIGGESRGECWEHLLSMVRCPIIALSATVQNPKDLLSWLQTLENSKQEMDRELKSQLRRSYTIRMIPREGKIERHSDLTKFKFHIESSLDIRYLHPIAYLNVEDLLRKREFPECMTMSPDECLSLYDALKQKFTEKELKSVDPEKIFESRFLDREDVQTLNSAIREFLLGLPNTKQIQQKLSDVLSQFPGHNQAFTTDNYNRYYLKSNFPKFVRELKDRQMLPALIFVFDRTLCQALSYSAADDFLREINVEKESTKYKVQKQKEIKLENEAVKKVKKLMNNSPATEGSGTGKTQEAAQNNCLANLNEYFREFPNQTLISRHSLGQQEALELEKSLRNSNDKRFHSLMRFGISYHHAGNNSKMKSSTEMLFREGFLNLVVSTTTLAQGIHMPCKTVVFAGDSVYLNSLNYHQCSGRAGRRGFDTDGKVVFYGVRESKIARLMNSNLPLIFGNSPSTFSLILKLYKLTCTQLKGEDRKDAMLRALGCLRNPLLTTRNHSLNFQNQMFFMYATEFLLRQDYIDEEGHPVGLAGLAMHLSHMEPFNFAFCHLLQEGVLHSLIRRTHKQEIAEDSLITLMTTLSFIFCRQKVFFKNQKLPSPPEHIVESLKAFNMVLNGSYRGFINSVSSFNPDTVTVSMPLTNLQYECRSAGVLEPLAEAAGVVDVEDGDNVKLLSNLSASLMTDTMPAIDLNKAVSGYALAFYKTGDRALMRSQYKIPNGEIFQLLQEFSMLLKTIETSVKEIGPEELGRTDDLIDAFESISQKFESNFNKAFGMKKKYRAWGNHVIHPTNCFTCSLLQDQRDKVERKGCKTWNLRGDTDCKSSKCVILLKCCKQSVLSTCKQTVGDKIENLKLTWPHFIQDHEVSLIILEQTRTQTDKALEDARISWKEKLKIDQCI